MTTRTFLLCLASTMVGAGASFLITRKILEKKYAKLVEDEIASIKEAFERAKLRPKVVREKKTKPVDVQQKEETKTGNPNGLLTRSSLDNDPYEKAKRDYHKIYSESEKTADDKVEADSDDPEEDKDEDDEVETDDAGKTEQDMLDLTKIDRTQPYIINDKEYSDEFPHHDKLSLYYYRVDDVLCEENEEIIDDVEAAVGYNAIQMLDTQTTIWVRNEPLGIDYEIIALNSSFAESVHGMHIKPLKEPPVKRIMTPRERYEEKQKRRENNGE